MIYIERTITISNTIDKKTKINNQSAAIDNPVILYKGDKNVEVNFIIENNPYKHRAGLETTYGQLVIKRPNSAPIFSDIAKVSSGKVLFVITGDMIDELTELGNYDFQIRLINADKTSRATLPPVSSGIVIKEPICDEATVNTANVNNIENAGVISGEPVDLFDEEGHYIKTVWKSGDLITDVRLNRVEDAIYAMTELVGDIDSILGGI